MKSKREQYIQKVILETLIKITEGSIGLRETCDSDPTKDLNEYEPCRSDDAMRAISIGLLHNLVENGEEI